LKNLTSHEINLNIKSSEKLCPKFTYTYPNVAKCHFIVLNASIHPSITTTKKASGS